MSDDCTLCSGSRHAHCCRRTPSFRSGGRDADGRDDDRDIARVGIKQ